MNHSAPDRICQGGGAGGPPDSTGPMAFARKRERRFTVAPGMVTPGMVTPGMVTPGMRDRLRAGRRKAWQAWSWLCSAGAEGARDGFGFAALAEREELGREVRPGQEATAIRRTAPEETPASRSALERRTGLSHPHRPSA